ncbi:hypothetical protein [Streptomyces sp. NPDC048392]
MRRSTTTTIVLSALTVLALTGCSPQYRARRHLGRVLRTRAPGR